MAAKCRCNTNLEFIYGWDNKRMRHAYNLFACPNCGTIYKEDVWDDKGVIQITTNNDIFKKEAI